MKAFKKSAFALAALLIAGLGLGACSDANEYEDAQTDNPSWVEGYTDSLAISHPESLTGTTWVRGSGMKYDAYGNEIQGYVESLNFSTADSVVVKMSEGVTNSSTLSNATWTDDSNSDETPYYEYTYSSTTGKVEILKLTVDEKGKVSKVVIFSGIAVSGTKEVITIAHYGDVPVQTYLVKQ